MRLLLPTALAAVLGGLVVLHPAGAAQNAAPAAATAPAGLPGTVLGLNVAREDVGKTLAQVTQPEYTVNTTLYSFRDPTKLLQATLQVSDFRHGTPASSHGFQLSIVGQIGGSQPEFLQLGSTTVYVTTLKGLVIAIWFRPERMYVLAVRNTFHQPKSLLRVAVGMQP